MSAKNYVTLLSFDPGPTAKVKFLHPLLMVSTRTGCNIYQPWGVALCHNVLNPSTLS